MGKLGVLSVNLVQMIVLYTPSYHCSTALVTMTDMNEIILTKQHKTPKALEHGNHLYCYNCNSMDHGADCINNQTLRRFEYKCHGENKICMTQRYSYTTSTENSTSAVNLWLLKRNCTRKCEPGCIVIGERTKLYACTQCCATNFCNVGKGASGTLTDPNVGPLTRVFYLLISYTVATILNPSDSRYSWIAWS